ncbi:hypothetical protein [Maricaulis sp.]|uniref:hypothetical protein n=1 Tax=Maricaulis sp. TaxID=1486257 RepID=UPI001B030F62|nr:hypothetical protein [Maricaulis sp.]MBO6797769.1 hypothetical protein [Maricaulis sp.]
MKQLGPYVTLALILIVLGGAGFLRLAPIAPAEFPAETPMVGAERALVDQAELAGVVARMRPLRRATPAAPTPRHPMSDYTLIGVVEADGGGWALLRDMDGVVTARIGQVVGGFELVELSPDGAIFARGSEEVLLERSY